VLFGVLTIDLELLWCTDFFRCSSTCEMRLCDSFSAGLSAGLADPGTALFRIPVKFLDPSALKQLDWFISWLLALYMHMGATIAGAKRTQPRLNEQCPPPPVGRSLGDVCFNVCLLFETVSWCYNLTTGAKSRTITKGFCGTLSFGGSLEWLRCEDVRIM
jgi:hypothetical protein